METEYYDFSYSLVVTMLSIICGFVSFRFNSSANHAGNPVAFAGNIFQGVISLIKYIFVSFIVIFLLTLNSFYKYLTGKIILYIIFLPFIEIPFLYWITSIILNC